jgi:hypothetical protein
MGVHWTAEDYRSSYCMHGVFLFAKKNKLHLNMWAWNVPLSGAVSP